MKNLKPKGINKYFPDKGVFLSICLFQVSVDLVSLAENSISMNPKTANRHRLQGSFCISVLRIRDDDTLQRGVSSAGHIHKMITEAACWNDNAKNSRHWISDEMAATLTDLNLFSEKEIVWTDSTFAQASSICAEQAASHYLSQCWPRSTSLYGITRPRWLK